MTMIMNDTTLSIILGVKEYNADVILMTCGQVNPWGHGKCIFWVKTLFCEYITVWQKFEQNYKNQDNLHEILHK